MNTEKGLDRRLSISLGSNLRALTGLRILAAVWVFCHHFATEIVAMVPPLEVLSPVFARGGLGVDLFFILSGFILSHTYGSKFSDAVRPRTYGKYIRARIARIYPVHFVILHIYVVAFLALGLIGQTIPGGGGQYTWSSYLQNLFLVQGWAGQPYSWNGVAWSVSVEWLAYLFFPFVVPMVHRIRSWYVLTMGVTVALALHLLIFSGNWAATNHLGPDNAVARITISFIIGCFVYRLASLRPLSRGVPTWGSSLAFLALITGCYLNLGSTAVMLPLTVLVVSLAYGAGPFAQLLSTRAFVKGGEISYSFYMVHALVLAIYRRFAPASAMDWPLLGRVAIPLVVLAATLGAAYVMYRWVEEPCRKIIRRARPRTAQPDTSGITG